MRKLKVTLRAKKLSDGKTLGGKGRLTDAVINEMQSYYGNAIRGNSSSVKDMTKAIWAICFHKGSTDLKLQHQFYQAGDDSWCKYQKAVSLGSLNGYKHPKTPSI